jgi:hypothetical protein
MFSHCFLFSWCPQDAQWPTHHTHFSRLRPLPDFGQVISHCPVDSFDTGRGAHCQCAWKPVLWHWVSSKGKVFYWRLLSEETHSNLSPIRWQREESESSEGGREKLLVGWWWKQGVVKFSSMPPHRSHVPFQGSSSFCIGDFDLVTSGHDQPGKPAFSWSLAGWFGNCFLQSNSKELCSWLIYTWFF